MYYVTHIYDNNGSAYEVCGTVEVQGCTFLKVKQCDSISYNRRGPFGLKLGYGCARELLVKVEDISFGDSKSRCEYHILTMSTSDIDRETAWLVGILSGEKIYQGIAHVSLSDGILQASSRIKMNNEIVTKNIHVSKVMFGLQMRDDSPSHPKRYPLVEITWRKLREHLMIADEYLDNSPVSVIGGDIKWVVMRWLLKLWNFGLNESWKLFGL